MAALSLLWMASIWPTGRTTCACAKESPYLQATTSARGLYGVRLRRASVSVMHLHGAGRVLETQRAESPSTASNSLARWRSITTRVLERHTAALRAAPSMAEPLCKSPESDSLTELVMSVHLDLRVSLPLLASSTARKRSAVRCPSCCYLTPHPFRYRFRSMANSSRPMCYPSQWLGHRTSRASSLNTVRRAEELSWQSGVRTSQPAATTAVLLAMKPCLANCLEVRCSLAYRFERKTSIGA